LGSISDITNQSGSVAQRYAYSSFGKIESQLDSTFVQPYTFTSREHDPETGLYHYRARSYDSSTARFIQEDPIGFAGGDVNLYRYAISNPLNLVDPSGKLLPLIAIIPVVAGVVNGALSGITASQACDATPLKILQAFGNGALGGIIGSLVGLGTGAATGNPILGGAAGNFTNNFVEQALGGQGLDGISATAATIGGGIGGAAAPKLLPLIGRTPYLTAVRTNYGPNSYRLIGQEIISESVEGSVDAAVGIGATAINGLLSNGCGC
jgi:RHS repeat-associated protein